MKKLTALMLSILIVLSASVALVGATEAEAPEWTTKAPDLFITEICPDQQGNGDAGYSGNEDPFEWFEIYNNSDITLNLYDYCLTYNGNVPTNNKYETQIIEITPFLTNNQWENKPGNYLDGSTLQWTNESKPVGDLSNLPTNPETCFIEPGECVVVWCMYYEAYLAAFNEGKGLSVEDFRKFWNIPDSVKVIAFDGNSSTTYGGHDKNFNIKNKDCGTYGIAKYSDALNKAANVVDSTYTEKTYREFEDLISWSAVDFSTWALLQTQANTTMNFTLDADGYGAQLLTELSGKEHLYDKRRAILCESYCEPTPGELSSVQKLTLPGYTFKAGETVTLPTAKEARYMTYDIWYERGQVLTGLNINGTVYQPGTTYTASAPGTVTVEPIFEVEQTTAAPEATEKPEASTAPATEKAPSTSKAQEENTAAQPEATTAAPEEKKGCGSSVAYAAVAIVAIFGTALVRKRK